MSSDNRRSVSATPKKDPKSGTWYFMVDAGVDGDGRRRQVHRRGFRTRADAEEELDTVRGQARTSSYTPPTKLTVASYLERWIAGLPATGLRPSTIDGYRRNMDYVIPVLGARRLDSLTALDLDQLYAKLSSLAAVANPTVRSAFAASSTSTRCCTGLCEMRSRRAFSPEMSQTTRLRHRRSRLGHRKRSGGPGPNSASSSLSRPTSHSAPSSEWRL